MWEQGKRKWNVRSGEMGAALGGGGDVMFSREQMIGIFPLGLYVAILTKAVSLIAEQDKGKLSWVVIPIPSVCPM